MVRSAGIVAALVLLVSACGDDGSTVGEPVDDLPDGEREPTDDADKGDDELAGLQADAVIRLVTVDNSFGEGSDPFDLVQITTFIGGDEARPLEPLAVETLTAELSGRVGVEFVDDPDAVIADHFENETPGVAVVTVTDIRIDGDRAEVELGLWCGSLCAIGLTYEAVLDSAGWAIQGTTGPITMS